MKGNVNNWLKAQQQFPWTSRKEVDIEDGGAEVSTILDVS